MRRPEALRAIGEPAKKSGDKSRAEKIAALSGALLDNLLTIPVQTRTGVKRVKGEFIEPVHLQVVCRDLWDRLETGPAISGSDLADVDRVLEDYYDRALRKVARRNPVLRWRARRWFERALITSAGTRGIVYMDEDKHSAAGMPDRVVRIFEDERLVRPERRGGAPWYELTHDRLIGPIRNSNGKNRRKTTKVGALLTVVTALVLVVVLTSHLLMLAALMAFETTSTWPSNTADTDAKLALITALVDAI